MAPPESWAESDIVARGGDLFRTAVGVWPRPAVEPENLADDESPTKGVWRFTDASALQQKRHALIEALAARERVTLNAESVARYSDPTGEVRVVVAISKHHVDRGLPYWYGHRPDWQAYLLAAPRGFLLLGCMDREEGFAIPGAVLAERIETLNNSLAKDGTIRHWHVHLTERTAGLALLLPRIDQVLDLTPYRIVAGVPVTAMPA